MNDTKLSKKISHALRHAPWAYELELDEQGFVPVEQLLYSLNEEDHSGAPITRADLERIIAQSEKQRFELNGAQIRALYGHSIPMHIQKDRGNPPKTLYHGTTHKTLPIILRTGLLPMKRQYVHLSVDIETAQQVGARRDADPVILTIDAASAAASGVPFYIGNNKVWLADQVPTAFIHMLSDGFQR